MKKLVLLLVAVFTAFSVLGCIDIETTESTTQTTTVATTTAATTTEATTSGDSTTTEATTTEATTTSLVVSDIPDEEVEITFWHIYGQGKTAVLDQLIAEFEAMYPNVTITATSQSDYNTLREKINMGLSVDPPQVPTMALGYPDHFAGYINAGAAFKLDNYIFSNRAYEITDSSSTIFGQVVPVGLDLEDFVPSYLAENNQYPGGFYYSVPFSKSTETMAVNRDVLKAHVTEIRALGIDISDEGFLSHETPLTYAQIEALQAVLVDTNGTNATTMKCEYLLNYDSSGNLFINMSRQFGAPYTNSAGEILIDNATTRSMLNYIQDLYLDNTMALPIIWEQSYGSTNFKYGDVCMTVGSTAGVSYNIPSAADVQENLQFGIFNVDFVQVPQFVENNGDEFTVNIDGSDETFTGYLSAVQQGPNIGIFADASANERLFAWLFIKYLIQTDNTAKWAMSTGYLPARLSSYSSEAEIELTPTFSTTYAGFLEIAQEYWENDGDVDWALTDERWDYLHSSMVANNAMMQNAYYQYDPAFAAGTNSAGSATARVEAGYCLENILIGTYISQSYDPEEALNFMINQLTW